MRVFAISDIHGDNDKFKSLLKKVGFKRSDKLFLLGDYIDRGAQSKEVLDTIMLLIENGYDIHCIRGNHEEMLITALNDIPSQVVWFKNGGDTTLKSFSTNHIERIPEVYINFILNLPYYLEFENFIFVHAGINMTIDNPMQDLQSILWLRSWKDCYDKKWLGNRYVVHGHTPMKASFLKSRDNIENDVICIDNGSYMRGAKDMGGICALNLTSKELIIL